MNRDVTGKVVIGSIDDELAPLVQCICGQKWGYWEGPILSIYKDSQKRCPECGRRYFISIGVRVFEVDDNP